MNHAIPKAVRKKLRQLHSEVENRFGVLPNLFRLPPESPEITAHVLGFARFCYLDNPLPSLFKGRLFAYLSRFCEARYCVAQQVAFVAGLGHPSGDAKSPVPTIEEIVGLLRLPFPRAERLAPCVSLFPYCESPPTELPGYDPSTEEAVARLSAIVESSDDAF
jgi:hypothetical protein